MRGTDEILHRRRKRHILNAEWNDGDTFARGSFYFAQYLRGVVGTRREHQNHEPAAVQCLNQGFAVRDARQYISRGNPATDTIALQCRTRSVGNCLVVGRIADKHVVRHGRIQLTHNKKSKRKKSRCDARSAAFQRMGPAPPYY